MFNIDFYSITTVIYTSRWSDVLTLDCFLPSMHIYGIFKNKNRSFRFDMNFIIFGTVIMKCYG